MKDLVELTIAILGFAGIAYRVAKTEEKIFDAIQSLEGELNPMLVTLGRGKVEIRGIAVLKN